MSSAELEQPLTSRDEALNLVLGLLPQPQSQQCHLNSCLDQIAAVDIISPNNVPRFDNSAVDGYAVEVAKTGTNHRFIDRVGTGKPIPSGADAVVAWEGGTLSGTQTVTSHNQVQPGSNIRRQGHDVAGGSILVTAGQRIGPAQLGLIASCGLSHVAVYRPARVGVLISGNELIPAGSRALASQVYDSNSPMLMALIDRSGGTLGDVKYVADDQDATAEALNQLTETSDIVVTTGGASVGETDWLRTCLEAQGKLAVWKVNVRPGKPFGAGTINGTAILMLPGNPASVFTCFHLFVAPALRAFSGQGSQRRVVCQLTNAADNNSERLYLCPVALSANGRFATALTAGSSQALSALSQSDGFVAISANSGLEPGSMIDIELHS